MSQGKVQSATSEEILMWKEVTWRVEWCETKQMRYLKSRKMWNKVVSVKLKIHWLGKEVMPATVA